MSKESYEAEKRRILACADKIKNDKEDERFSAELEKFLQNKGRKRTSFLTVGITSNALLLAGANSQLEVVIAPRTIAKCMAEPDQHYHGHGLSKELMEQLPEQLRTPVMIFEGNRENSIVLITELADKESREIMIAVNLNARRERHEVNEIASIYGRNNMANYIRRQIEEGKLIAVNKEKADTIFQSIGLQLPQEGKFICFNNSISYTMENVNAPEQTVTKISPLMENEVATLCENILLEAGNSSAVIVKLVDTALKEEKTKNEIIEKLLTDTVKHLNQQFHNTNVCFRYAITENQVQILLQHHSGDTAYVPYHEGAISAIRESLKETNKSHKEHNQS